MKYLNIIDLMQDVLSGEESPFKALALAKEYKKTVDECLLAIEAEAIEQGANYEKNFEMDGYEFTKREGSRSFDYKHIEEWMQKKAELKAIEEKYKSAYNAFQRNLQPVTMDGEVLTLPTVKQGKESILIKPIK